ncbi:hypothetical protein ACQ4WP_27585 [Janthinobacterium sp. GB4P2]|uniref:hypothetical protein n=1 Tax=Janthinobacterium sp. GB4P2 TaxID=3424189 RepID=UPI003F2073A8
MLASNDHDEHPDLRAMVAMVDCRIVAERYYNGETADALHDSRVDLHSFATSQQ